MPEYNNHAELWTDLTAYSTLFHSEINEDDEPQLIIQIDSGLIAKDRSFLLR